MINSLYDISPGLLPATAVIILIITIFVLLERTWAAKLRERGDIYPALTTFSVILSKTLIPLAALWVVFKLSPTSLAWLHGGLFQALWKGLALAFCMMVFMVIYQKYSHLLFGKPYASTGAHFLSRGRSKAVMGIGISAALLNAFGEEIIFRALLFPALATHSGVVMALFMQSLVFTIYHFFPLQNSLLLFVMGIFFGLGYLWSGSLLTPVLAHLIENGLPALIITLRSLRAPLPPDHNDN